MLPINPKWLLEKAGITVDEETAELIAVLLMRLQNAPDKGVFLKDCLRRAMRQDPMGGESGLGQVKRRIRGKNR